MGEVAGQSAIVCCLVRADAHAAVLSIRNTIVIARDSGRSFGSNSRVSRTFASLVCTINWSRIISSCNAPNLHVLANPLKLATYCCTDSPGSWCLWRNKNRRKRALCGLQSVRSVVPRLCHNHLWCPTRALPAHADLRLPSNAVTALFCGLRSRQSAPLPKGKSQRTVTSESRESEARRVEQGKGQEVVVRYQPSSSPNVVFDKDHTDTASSINLS